MKFKPVDRKVPEDDRANQKDALIDGPVLIGHAVLCRIGEKNDEQDVGRAQASGLALQHKPQQEEDREVRDGATNEDLPEGVRGDEHIVPGLIHERASSSETPGDHKRTPAGHAPLRTNPSQPASWREACL
jgi:hypothetical protein